MDSEELLAQLADIHLPEAVGFWPPAPGWWLLGLLLLVAGAILARVLLLRHRQRQVRSHALAEFDRCLARYREDSGEDEGVRKRRYVNEANAVLRRVALVHYPQANVASLSGLAWVDFIRENGDSSRLDDDISAALGYGRFQTRCDVDIKAMDAFGRDWVSSQYLRPSAPPSAQGIRT